MKDGNVEAVPLYKGDLFDLLRLFLLSRRYISRRAVANLRGLQSEFSSREQICFHTPSACGGVLDFENFRVVLGQPKLPEVRWSGVLPFGGYLRQQYWA